MDDVGALSEYLGCNLTFNWDKRSCRFTQPVLVQSLRDEYAATDTATCVPATPGSVLCRPSEGDEGLSDELQKDCKAKVGRLLHMVAWSRPDISNAVRMYRGSDIDALKKTQKGSTASNRLRMANARERMVSETNTALEWARQEFSIQSDRQIRLKLRNLYRHKEECHGICGLP